MKRRKDASVIHPIGTCSLQFQDDAVAICPNRFLERQNGRVKIFGDAAELAGIALTSAMWTSEVNIPGGRVDYLVYEQDADGLATNLVGVEFQTLDTTGTAWPARENFLRSQGINDADILAPLSSKSQLKTLYSMNWKHTSKTILVQMLHKAETFEHVNGRLVLAVQRPLWDTMKDSFRLGDIDTQAHDAAHTVHFFIYDLEDAGAGNGYQLGNLVKRSATVAQLRAAMDAQRDARVELSALQTKIASRAAVSGGRLSDALDPDDGLNPAAPDHLVSAGDELSEE